jgi:hypothetical protein
MKKTALIILAPLVILLPIGCPTPGSGSSPAAPGDSGTAGTVQQQDNLFVVQQNGEYDFSTNDSAYQGTNGFTFWALPLPGQTPFTQRDVTLAKSSGNAYAGYGIVFCQYDTGNPILGETMLVVMINNQQQYSVGEATGSTYTPYTSSTWVQSQYLNKGPGPTNTVNVTRDSSSGLFTLKLNGAFAMTFHDGRIPLKTGGGDGYLAVISPQDSFPGTPVTVMYKDY